MPSTWLPVNGSQPHAKYSVECEPPPLDENYLLVYTPGEPHRVARWFNSGLWVSSDGIFLNPAPTLYALIPPLEIQ